ncbi:hypothetical protein [Herpetosiphon geysericola]|uniref:Uncharacterized protein n=1 Tax=Herpetosiphon geysericola TaxID=70996 RepID=A0A0P6YMH2_9CHLR|nr:hypothetical protein [Herpetosiphon geysericola]KPL91407.1 hypothetical protein SE18_01765 [Herpetosiphon geysericola]
MNVYELLDDLCLKIDAISMSISVQDHLSNELDTQVCACAYVLFATLTNQIEADKLMTDVLEAMAQRITLADLTLAA